MARVYNFSAGPAVLPEEVLKEAQEKGYAERNPAYESPVQKWQAETERAIDLKEIKNLYRYPYRGLPQFDAWKEWRKIRQDETGAMRYYGMNREYVIVPAHCMLVKRSVFVQLGGFSDKFRTELSALDFCLRVREHGFLSLRRRARQSRLSVQPDVARVLLSI